MSLGSSPRRAASQAETSQGRPASFRVRTSTSWEATRLEGLTWLTSDHLFRGPYDESWRVVLLLGGAYDETNGPGRHRHRPSLRRRIRLSVCGRGAHEHTAPVGVSAESDVSGETVPVSLLFGIANAVLVVMVGLALAQKRGLSLDWLSRSTFEDRHAWRQALSTAVRSRLARFSETRHLDARQTAAYPADSARPQSRGQHAHVSSDDFFGAPDPSSQTDRRLVELCERLAAATTVGQVEWAARDDTTFVCSRQSATLVLLRFDRAGLDSHELALYNPRGAKVDSLRSRWSQGTAASWNEALAVLYDTARRQALGVDSLLDALLTELPPPRDVTTGAPSARPKPPRVPKA